jgi:hypothetical protein
MAPTVAGLAADNGQLYAGGTFRQAGGTAASNIARWDGMTWSALDSGIQGETVLALVPARGEVLAGGRFGFAGGKPASDFSLWRFPPVLRIALRSDAVQLSWPITATGYVLQTSDDLSKAAWRPVTNGFTVVGDQYVVLPRLTNHAQFFRLHQEQP